MSAFGFFKNVNIRFYNFGNEDNGFFVQRKGFIAYVCKFKCEVHFIRRIQRRRNYFNSINFILFGIRNYLGKTLKHHYPVKKLNKNAKLLKISYIVANIKKVRIADFFTFFGYQPMLITLNFAVSPPGRMASAISPTFLPIRALPTGDSSEIFPRSRSASVEPTMTYSSSSSNSSS